jgi:altronate dehydratase small subunit
MSQARCYRIHGDDNVATMLDDAPPGAVAVLGQASEPQIVITEAIQLGHKVALRDIQPGEAIIKYGVAIGRAARPIPCGGWVHLHNCLSSFDERSQTFDVQTGAAKDTRYE